MDITAGSWHDEALFVTMTQMVLYIAGVCHQDPKGKANLKAWLQALSAANDEPPAFVGVEYDKNKFAELKQQRPRLRQTIESHCPSASSDLLDALVDCFAYERDAVAEVFPNLEPLWLDAGTANTTDDRYMMWVNYYKGVPFRSESAEALALLNEAAWDRFNPQPLQFPDPGDVPRSETFACQVLDSIKRGSGGWAIVVVGAYHASGSIPESMRSRLTDAGIECKVYLIKPNGPVPA